MAGYKKGNSKQQKWMGEWDKQCYKLGVYSKDHNDYWDTAHHHFFSGKDAASAARSYCSRKKK